MIGYYNIYDNGNKKMNFICDDKNLSENIKKKWEKISSIKSKKLIKEPTYKSSNNAYIRLNIKVYVDWLTNFYNEKSPKENTRYKCLALIMLESISKLRGNEYHPQLFIYDLNNNLKNINSKKRINRDFEKKSDESHNEPESETYSGSEEFVKFSKKSKNSSKKSDDDESDNNKSENNEYKKSSKKSKNNESENNESENIKFKKRSGKSKEFFRKFN